MASTAITAPALFASHEAAGLTPTWIHTDRLERAMQDRIDPIATGLVSLKGDLAGSGTDEMRITFVDGIEFDERFAAMGSETDTPTPSGSTVGYSVLTIATYGMAKSETWRQSQLGKPGTFVSVEEAVAAIPGSFLATIRYLACVAGSAISSTIGAAADDLTADDWYLLREAMISTDGAGDRGMPQAWLHPAQFNQLSESFRSEPAFVQNFEAWKQAAEVNPSRIWSNFAGMGVDIRLTSDVQSSGGAYLGFCGAPGFMGWGRASTSRIPVPAAAEPMRVDAYGLLLHRALDQLANRTNQINAYAEIGIAVGDTSVYFQRRLRSTTS